MIKSCSGEAGEGIDDATNARGCWALGCWALGVGRWTLGVGAVVHDDEGVDGVVVHFLAGIHDLGVLADCFRVSGHNVRNGRGEERLS